jgi:hypothetical protein
MTSHKSLILSAVVTALLTACGGSSDSDSNSLGGNGSAITYSGVTTPATITSDNSEALAESGTAVTKSLTARDNSAQLPIGITSNTQSAQASETIRNSIKQIRSNKDSSSLPIGITEEETISGNCGGSATSTYTDTNFSSTFNNFCENGTTINGTISGSYTATTDSWTSNNITISVEGSTITFSGSGTCSYTDTAEVETETCADNIQITENGITNNYSFSETCIYTVSTGAYDCTETEYLQADNGQTYQVDDSYVSGNNTNGWYASGTFYDPAHGSVDFYASNIQYCQNGNIESGTITITDDSDNTLLVTFVSCSEMTISLDNGTAETVAQ